MPEVVFYQPLQWLAVSLTASAVGCFLSVALFSLFGSGGWGCGDGRVVDVEAAVLCLQAGSGCQSAKVPWSKHRSLKDSKRASK